MSEDPKRAQIRKLIQEAKIEIAMKRASDIFFTDCSILRIPVYQKLKEATQNNDEETVSLLIEEGLDLDCLKSSAPVKWAIKTGNINLVKLLWSRHCYGSLRDKGLIKCIQFPELVKYLIKERKLPVDGIFRWDGTALIKTVEMLVAIEKEKDIIYKPLFQTMIILLQNGANPNFYINYKWNVSMTLLSYTLKKGSDVLSRILSFYGGEEGVHKCSSDSLPEFDQTMTEIGIILKKNNLQRKIAKLNI